MSKLAVMMIMAAALPGTLSAVDLGDGTIGITYDGPMESSVGKFWPMTATRKGKVITVRIETRSRPSDPGGATLQALGPNRGSVSLGNLPVGEYTVKIQQGDAKCDAWLVVTETAVTFNDARPLKIAPAYFARDAGIADGGLAVPEGL